MNQVLLYNLQCLSNLQKDPDSIKHLIEFNDEVVKKFSSMAIVESGLRKANELIVSYLHQERPSESLPAKFRKLINDMHGLEKKIIKNCMKIVISTNNRTDNT